MKLGFKEKCFGGFLFLMLIESRLGDQLFRVDHIMVDISKPIGTKVSHIRGVCAKFQKLSPIYLQLWSPTSDPDNWKLVWQAKLTPNYGDNKEEVLSLSSEDYSPEIKPEYRLGMINPELPGPVNGITHPNSTILLSIDTLDKMTLPLNISVVKEFDDLKMRYDFSLDICKSRNCMEIASPDRCSRTGDPPVAAASISSGFQILSEDMVLGLIIWNLVLSFVVVCTLITIVCMCNTLQKRKKDVRRFDNKYRNLEIASTGTISTKGDDVIYTHGKSDDVAKSSTSRDSWVSTDGDRKKLHANDALEY